MRVRVNSFHPIAVLHIETSPLIGTAQHWAEMGSTIEKNSTKNI